MQRTSSLAALLVHLPNLAVCKSKQSSLKSDISTKKGGIASPDCANAGSEAVASSGAVFSSFPLFIHRLLPPPNRIQFFP